MAIIDHILNKKKTASHPMNMQQLQQEATHVPDIPETRAADQDDKQPAEIIQAQDEVAMPAGNKWGYSQDEMEWLGRHGYTPERLDYYNADFDPSKGDNILERIYSATASRPSVPDEKKIKRSRTIAGVTDGLGLLSQMYSAGRGAHVKERGYNESASAQMAAQERNLRNIYRSQSDKYNDGLLNAMYKDILKALDDYNNGRKGISGVLTAKQKLDQAQAQFEGKQGLAREKFEFDKEKFEQDSQLARDRFEESARHNKVSEDQVWSRIQDSKNRTTAYMRSTSSGGKKGYQMVIKADPNDREAQEDGQFGGRVRVFEMTDGEIDRYAREVLKDTAFINRHPEIVLQEPQYKNTPYQTGSYKFRPNKDIAAAYLEEQYRNAFKKPTVSSAPGIPSFDFDWTGWKDYPQIDGEEDQDEWFFME